MRIYTVYNLKMLCAPTKDWFIESFLVEMIRKEQEVLRYHVEYFSFAQNFAFSELPHWNLTFPD